MSDLTKLAVVSEFNLSRPYRREDQQYVKVLAHTLTYKDFNGMQTVGAEAFDLGCKYAVRGCTLSDEQEVNTIPITTEILESHFQPSDMNSLIAAVGALMGGFEDYEAVGDGLQTPIYYKLHAPVPWITDTTIIGFEFKARNFGAMRKFLTADGFHGEISAFMEGYATVSTNSGEEVPYSDAILNKMDCRDIFTIREHILSGKFMGSQESFKKR